MIVLHESIRDSEGGIFVTVIRLDKKASRVAQHARFDDPDIRQGGFHAFQRLPRFFGKAEIVPFILLDRRTFLGGGEFLQCGRAILIVFFVILAICAVSHARNPLGVGAVPADRFTQSSFERVLRLPT